MDNVRPHENDDVSLFIEFFRFAKQRADERQAAQAWDPRFVLGLRVADHAAEHEEVLVRNVDVGGHVGLGRADAVDSGVAVHRLAVDAFCDLFVQARLENTPVKEGGFKLFLTGLC